MRGLMRLFFNVGAASTITIFSTTGHATESTDQTDPTLAQAQLKQNIAQAQQATAEAELATAKAKIGQIDATLPKGQTTATSLHIEGTILAYRAAEKAADQIAANVATLVPNKKVVLFSSKELAWLNTYRSFKFQTSVLLANIPKLTTDPKLTSDSLPPSCVAPTRVKVPPLLLIGVALELASLFKSDNNITGSDVTVDDFAMNSLMAEKLKARGFSIAYPPLFFPNLLEPAPLAPTTQTEQTFKNLNDGAFNLSQFVKRMNDKKMALTAAREKASTKCKAIYDDDIANVDDAQAKASAAQTAINQILTGLTTTDPQSGLTTLQNLTYAEQLGVTFQSASILQVKSIAAGGNTQTKTGTFSTTLSFSGGVVLTYMLIEKDGSISTSGVVPVYGGYIDSSDMK
ncbi:hypothetical protein [Massilia sp.]|uniref:hypothetical protein n=1 Tax=Massilia sp. TaxID=1882437 RepID=UPI00352EC81B